MSWNICFPLWEQEHKAGTLHFSRVRQQDRLVLNPGQVITQCLLTVMYYLKNLFYLPKVSETLKQIHQAGSMIQTQEFVYNISHLNYESLCSSWSFHDAKQSQGLSWQTQRVTDFNIENGWRLLFHVFEIKDSCVHSEKGTLLLRS